MKTFQTTRIVALLCTLVLLFPLVVNATTENQTISGATTSSESRSNSDTEEVSSSASHETEVSDGEESSKVVNSSSAESLDSSHSSQTSASSDAPEISSSASDIPSSSSLPEPDIIPPKVDNDKTEDLLNDEKDQTEVGSFEKYSNDDLFESSHEIPDPYTDRMIEAYRVYSPRYQKIALQSTSLHEQHRIYSAQADGIEARLQQIISLIDAARKQEEEYKKEGNVIGQLNAIASIQNFKAEFDQQLIKYASACLERDLSSYQAACSANITSEEQRISEFGLYRQYAMIPLYNAQVSALHAQIEELSMALTVEQVKLDTGYTIPVAVNQIESARDLSQAEHDKAVSALEGMTVILLANTGLDSLPTDFPTTHFGELDDVQHYVNSFLEGNTTASRLETALKAYDRYIEYAERNGIDSEQQKIQRQLVQLDLNQYQDIDIPNYVGQCVRAYADIRQKVQATEKELQNNLEQQRVTSLLISKGRSIPLEMQKLKSQQAKIKMGQEQLLYSANLIKFILDYKIENQSISDIF